MQDPGCIVAKIGKSLIQYLQQFEKKVPNIHYDSTDKFVCGTVLSINNNLYYVPISHIKAPYKTSLLIYKGSRIISSMRFSFMFPAMDKVLIPVDFEKIAKTDKKYSDLIQTEYAFCRKHEAEIYKKAEAVYKIGCNKNHGLNHTCCDFLLLENVYMDFQENVIV